MIRDPYAWGGPSYPAYDGLLKGDSTAKAAEKSQLGFSQQLQQIFGAQFGQQSQITSFLNGKLQQMVNNPTGYAPGALTAMRTSATDTIAGQYANATKAAQASIAAHGGNGLPSGVAAQIEGQLKQGQASDTSGAQNQITMANENLRQSNYWNALSGLAGVGNMLNPLGYAGGSNSSANSVAGLSEAYSQSQNAGFLNHFMNSLGSSLGNTLGGGNPGQGWFGHG